MILFKRIFLLCCIAWLIAGCSDDFLDAVKKQPTTRSSNALYITPTSGYMEHTVAVPNTDDNEYSIGQQPKWLDFRYSKGRLKDGSVTLKFTVRDMGPGTGKSELTLIVEDAGIYVIPVVLVDE